jgi:hypothetical protein
MRSSRPRRIWTIPENIARQKTREEPIEEFFVSHSLPADHAKTDEIIETKSTIGLLMVASLSP